MKCNLDDMVCNAIWIKTWELNLELKLMYTFGTKTCELNLKLNLCSWSLHHYMVSFWMLFEPHLDHLVVHLILNHLKVNL